jgi:hypothetical protein
VGSARAARQTMTATMLVNRRGGHHPLAESAVMACRRSAKAPEYYRSTSSLHQSGRVEPVPHPRLGDEITGIRRVRFQLPAQLSYKDTQVFRLLL